MGGFLRREELVELTVSRKFSIKVTYRAVYEVHETADLACS